jgi:hypothetical protein
MSDETFAAPTSSEPGSEMTAPSEADYDAICAAVMETVRGRWFLAEYSRRNRHTDTELVLAAIDRVESALRDQRPNQSLDHFRHDLIEMAKAIAQTKSEMGTIKPHADGSDQIGEVTEQLDAVVQASAQTTSGVLAAAEQIQEVAWTMREQGVDSRLGDELDARAAELRAIGSSQGLATQRTQKVVHVMRYIEGRINDMIDVWGTEPLVVTGPRPKEAQRHLPSPPREDSAPPELSETHAGVSSTGYANGNGHDVREANGHILLERDIEAAMREAVSAANATGAEATIVEDERTVVQAPAAAAVAPAPSPAALQAAAQDLSARDLPGRNLGEHDSDGQGLGGQDSDTKDLSDAQGRNREPARAAAGSQPEIASARSDTAAPVFPTDRDSEPVPLPPDVSAPPPLVVLSEPAGHSGPVVVTPENKWAIEAMTSPAFESVIIISDDDEAADGVTTTPLSDLYALHVERSAGARSERAPNTNLRAPVVEPLEAQNTEEATTPAARRPIVIDLDLDPLTGSFGGLGHVIPAPAAAEIPQSPATESPRPSPEPPLRVVAQSQTDTSTITTRSDGAKALEPEQMFVVADPVTVTMPTGLEPPPSDPQPPPAPVVSLNRPEPRSAVSPPSQDGVLQAPSVAAEAPLALAQAPESSAAASPTPAAVIIEPTSMEILGESEAAAATAAPVAKPTASANVKAMRPQPPPTPTDPIAAIAALSDEEKIALFS